MTPQNRDPKANPEPTIASADDLLPDDIDLELLQELEQQNLDAIRQQRRHARFEVRVPVTIRPANLSEPEDRLQTGTSRDLSSGGCLAHFTRPVGVGDVFRITIQHESLSIANVFCRCLRCIFVREDVFEVGFCFFNPVTFDKGSGSQELEDLID